jgi:long-subunit fatty acid transport protein
LKDHRFFYGTQFNVSLKLSEQISVGLGARYVIAKEVYKGEISNVLVTAAEAYGGTQTAGSYLRTVAMTPGLPPVTVATLNGTADAMDMLTADTEVDIEKSGTGITPIISLNFRANDRLNLAFKYEHKTKLELETKVKDGKDGGLYTDGNKERNDIPSLLQLGAAYQLNEQLLVSTGFHYYFDKQADWDDRQDELDNNSWEFALGAEYMVSEKLAASIGWLRTRSYGTAAYQTDLSHTLPSNTLGGGFAFKLNPKFELNLAGSYTAYAEKTYDKERNLGGDENNPVVAFKETYSKPIWIASVGLNINLGFTE